MAGVGDKLPNAHSQAHVKGRFRKMTPEPHPKKIFTEHWHKDEEGSFYDTLDFPGFLDKREGPKYEVCFRNVELTFMAHDEDEHVGPTKSWEELNAMAEELRSEVLKKKQKGEWYVVDAYEEKARIRSRLLGKSS